MFLTTDKLRSRFADRLAGSNRVDIATAWATRGPVLDLLCKAATERGVKVRTIVGTYGYATHPDALERLRDIGTLRLVEGSRAMFHPKVYIFSGRRGARAWIGSANFTGAGFARNEEAVHETQDLDDAVDWFKGLWKACGPLDPGAIAAYRERRRKHGVSKSLAGLVGRPETGKGNRLALLGDADSWAEYVRALEKCDETWLDEGRGWSVLGESRSYVHTIDEGGRVVRPRSWIGLDDQERTIILGLRDGVEGTWGLLGTLIAAGTVKGVFHRSNKVENRRILGRVRNAVERVINATDDDFPDAAVIALEQICSEGGFGHGAATRLLALARPDRLVSVNSKSCVVLATAFDVKPTTLGEPKNYRLLLERLYAAPWYGDRPGRKRRERQLWNMRAALVDCFVYDASSEA